MVVLAIHFERRKILLFQIKSTKGHRVVLVAKFETYAR